jgi:hypothetical protein
MMKWQLTDRHGKPIAAGSLEQMLTHLKFTAKDGEYQLVRGDTAIHTQRHQGTLYPFEQWDGYLPLERVLEHWRESQR